jgi:hypothetical protein
MSLDDIKHQRYGYLARQASNRPAGQRAIGLTVGARWTFTILKPSYVGLYIDYRRWHD